MFQFPHVYFVSQFFTYLKKMSQDLVQDEIDQFHQEYTEALSEVNICFP